MSTAIQIVVVGILLGLIYTLAGLGMTLSLGILKVLNLAHGMAIIAGCILAYELYSTWHVTPTISAVIAIPVLFVAGVALHVVLVRRAQRASSESTLLVLFGAMLLLQAVGIQAWSGDSHSLTVGYSNSSVRLGSVVIRDDYLVAAAGALVLLVLLYLALRFTMVGRAVRALAQHRDAARMLGIDVDRYASLVFGLSIAVAGASGALLADIFPFSVQSQTQWLAYAFIVVLVGGAGGVLNAAVGGLALGLGQAVFNQLIPLTWVPVAVYGLLLVAMVARGGGLTATRGRTVNKADLRSGGIAQPSEAAAARPDVARSQRARGFLGAGGALVVVVGLAVWGSASPDVATIKIVSTVLMYVALAEGWNLLGGYAGYVNFGSVIFLGLGAYTTAIASTATGLTPLATAPLAALAAAAAAILIAVPAFRLRGDYFAVATFVLTLGLQQLAGVLGITGGAFGLFLRPTVSSLDGAIRLFFFAFLGLAVLSVAVCFALERSRWFSALVAIREDEDAAEVLGVPTLAVKVALLVAGAVIAGLAGCLYAAQLGYIQPTGTFDFNVSLAVVVGAVLGGMGTWYGPVVGAAIAELVAQELFTRVQGVWNQVVFGALLMAVVLIAPRGLTALGRRRSGRRFGV